MLAPLLILLLCSCSGILSRPEPPQVFTPTIRMPAGTNSATVNWQLQIGKPIASRALDNARIAVLPTPGEIQAYRGAAWSDAAPELLQTLIVRAFEDSGRIVGVGRQSSGLRSEFLLLLELRALQAEYRQPDAAPVAVVEFGAQLVQASSNRVLAARRFRTEQAADSTELRDVIGALELGLGQEIAALLDWTLQTGEANAQTVGR